MSEIVAKLRGTAILDELRQIADEAANEIDRLNAALRAARNEALEEAAKAIGDQKKQLEQFIRVAPFVTSVDLFNSGLNAAEATVRALKDKQP